MESFFIRLNVMVVAFFGLAGCILIRSDFQVVPPSSETLLASLGTIGVVSVAPAPAVTLEKSFFACVPESTAQEITAKFLRVLFAYETHNTLRGRVLLLARHGPSVKDNILDIGTGDARNPESPDYRPLAGNGVQTVLEIRSLPVQVSMLRPNNLCPDKTNPHLGISMSARARLIRTSDNRVLWVKEFEWATADSFFFYIENDAANLKSSLGTLLRSLSEQISNDAFGGRASSASE